METKKLKKRILELSHKAKEGHIGSSLSILDILLVLYDKTLGPNDQFVLSKGHASLGLYVALEAKGLISNLDSFCDYHSPFGGHPKRGGAILASTGSLGHGMPMAIGLALAKKIKKEKGRVFCLIGDGECNEGTIWESALLATHHKLDNFVLIVDQNHSSDRALHTGSLHDKFTAFGMKCSEIDGHTHAHIEKSLQERTKDQPLCIIANTVKGKGIKEMEHNPEWHHKSPSKEHLEKFIQELNA